MARCPFAQWRPLGPQGEPRLRRKNIVTLHTMVGSLDGTDAYFRQSGYSGVESHFGVGGDGTIYQWQDTSHQADAQAEGNDNCVSIETADHGPEFPGWSGSNVPAWTDAQLDAIVRLVRWLCDTHDIPTRLVPDSGGGRHGIGYHRQGVDPWRETGAEVWSDAYGKVCPGDRRIRQIKNDVIPRVQGDDDVVTEADKKDIAREVLRGLKFDDPTRYPKGAGRSPEADDINLVEAVQKLLEYSYGADAVPIPASAFGQEYRDTNENFTGPNAATHTWDASEKDLKLTRQVLNVAKNIADKVGAPADVDEQAIVKGVLAGLSPQAVAAAVVESLPNELAQQVVHELAAQLSQ